jgi:hypothetical protein
MLCVAFVAALSLVGSTVPAGASAHCLVTLAEYIPSSLGPLYFGSEGVETQFSIVQVPQQDCYATPQANYHADNGTATNGSDFLLPDGETSVEGEVTVLVPLTDDNEALAESAVETATVVLGANVTVARPSSVPLHISDADGADRVTLFASSVAQVENEMSARIPVFRAGSAAAPISVGYTITPGTATAGADYQAPTEGTLSFPAGVRLQFIEFDVLDDSAPPFESPEETIQISITPPPGLIVEEPSTMTFSILDDDQDQIRPATKFHHPRQGWTYKRSDYRIREMHVFAKDEGLSGIAIVEMALRKKKTDGSCSWWDDQTRRWEPGSCTDQHWVTMEFLGPWTPTWPELYEEDFPRLTPSMGTAIRNYTAWSRATDRAGNVEALPFVKGRNWNTFEVKR